MTVETVAVSRNGSTLNPSLHRLCRTAVLLRKERILPHDGMSTKRAARAFPEPRKALVRSHLATEEHPNTFVTPDMGYPHASLKLRCLCEFAPQHLQAQAGGLAGPGPLAGRRRDRADGTLLRRSVSESGRGVPDPNRSDAGALSGPASLAHPQARSRQNDPKRGRPEPFPSRARSESTRRSRRGGLPAQAAGGRRASRGREPSARPCHSTARPRNRNGP